MEIVGQPHRKKIKHYHQPGHLHELTFSCFHQMPLLTNDAWRMHLSRSVETACEQHRFQLVAFVFMPEHVHLLVLPLCPEPDIGLLLAAMKQPFSRQIKQILIDRNSSLLERLTVQERPGKKCFRFWQAGPGFDRNIYSAKAIAASIDYIHTNPVTRGLCKRAIDWKWSSARYYHAEPMFQQCSNLPTIARLPPQAFDDFSRVD
ncbi:REP-associated tyrosine transposase [Rosistilla ulvae]|nr:transposase [Rosistilla ulvae]